MKGREGGGRTGRTDKGRRARARGRSTSMALRPPPRQRRVSGRWIPYLARRTGERDGRGKLCWLREARSDEETRLGHDKLS